LLTLFHVKTRVLSVTVTRRFPGAPGTHDGIVGDGPVDVEGVVEGAVGADAAPSPLLQPMPNAATSTAAEPRMRFIRERWSKRYART
jgi:hypothetical protein